jgi:hypothetical protein
MCEDKDTSFAHVCQLVQARVVETPSVPIYNVNPWTGVCGVAGDGANQSPVSGDQAVLQQRVRGQLRPED